MTFEELKQVLFVRGNFGMKLGLERMREALSLLGDPHLAVPVLHVAGTNGKGSTCAFTEAALRVAGLKTGLYTSPHLVHFCERIRIAGEPVPEERAAMLLEEILRRVPWALRDDGLTFFELATLMAFLAFAQERVQVAVVEVGLGGRLDATNVVEPLACAVATIGLDHVQWLGPTLSDVFGVTGALANPQEGRSSSHRRTDARGCGGARPTGGGAGDCAVAAGPGLRLREQGCQTLLLRRSGRISCLARRDEGGGQGSLFREQVVFRCGGRLRPNGAARRSGRVDR